MKLTITTDKLCALLDAAKPAISTRSTLPILSHVLLKAEAGQLRVSATTLDIWIEATDEATIEADGAVCLPFLRLINAAKQFDGATVAIEAKNGAANFKSGASSLKLPTTSADEFPPVPPSADGHRATIADLSAIFRRGLPFASVDTTRYVINAVFLTKGAAVSTDGNQLLWQEIDYHGLDCIVPNATVAAVAAWGG
jgi:DNA polymerase III subunit beta